MLFLTFFQTSLGFSFLSLDKSFDFEQRVDLVVHELEPLLLVHDEVMPQAVLLVEDHPVVTDVVLWILVVAVYVFSEQISHHQFVGPVQKRR